MKHGFIAVVLSALALVLAAASPPSYAQGSIEASAAENGNLWFVELSGAPVADGGTLSSVRAEKAAFRKAAAAAKISFTERRAYDVLFNGLSVSVNAADRSRLATLSGVKAIWPVQTLDAPAPEISGGGTSADLASAVAMTGANLAQNTLGLTGQGVKVGIIDTGIDLDHPDFGGTGVNGTTPFPSTRVIAGFDFVGNAFNSGGSGAALIPVPDANPDDCAGHGTHVAGIVGANGAVKGVAPGVKFGAYKVFGCAGTTDAGVILAAMEAAYQDGMHVINMSLGANRQWPQYPTAAAATRLVNKGVIVVTSIGNAGPGGNPADALFAGGAPGTGAKAIAVASYDNTASTQLAFQLTPGGELIGYDRVTGAALSPLSGSLPMAKTGTPAVVDDGCLATNFALVPAGSAVLIRRGICGFGVKAANAQAAGAAAVVLYNNSPVNVSPTVAGFGVTIPVVFITAANGALVDSRIASGPTTLTWTSNTVSTPIATGGLISTFSSWGLAADLSIKPNIGAPGGSIYSTYPVELGSYTTLSGTSMSSPHVAGAVALVLEAKPNLPSNAMRARLQNSADPKNWNGNPTLGLVDAVHKQGAGMLDIMGTIQAKTVVEPAEIALGESQAGPKTVTLSIKNEGAASVTYDLGHTPGVASGPNTLAAVTSYVSTGTFDAPATVTFAVPSVVVAPGTTSTVDVTIEANVAVPNRSLYGGYVTLTPQGGGAVYRVPFAGLKGDYQSTVVLTPTPNGFPWLAQLSGTNFLNRTVTGATYTMVGNDVPFVLMHLDHLSRRVKLEAFEAVGGKAWGRITDDEYVARNSTPTGFFASPWNGLVFRGKGKNGSQWDVVPDGQYVIKLSVLKALGDENDPAHWETWTSSTVTIARP